METIGKMESCEPECPVKKTSEILEGKWTTLVIRELLGGTKRFSDLQRGLPGISAKVLAVRLRELEQRGLVDRTVHPTVPPKTEYSLTPLGRKLEVVLAAMANFGASLPADSRREQVTPRVRSSKVLSAVLLAAFCFFGAVDVHAQVGTARDSVVAAATPDSVGAGIDSTGSALENLSRDVQDVGRDIATGNLGEIKRRFQALIGRIAVDFFPRMIGALVVLLVSLILYWLVKAVLGRTLKHSRAVDAGLEHILMRTYRIVALTFIAVLVLSQFGVNVAALLAGLSVVGIAVGFAAQDTVQNYIAGITILIDKPFSVGDNVEVDGVFGSVNKITLRSTRVRTQNGEIMVMPNVQMINQKLINHTALPTLRVEVPFGIAYKEFPEEARKVVLATTEGDDRLDPDQPPEVVVTQMNNSSVDLSLRLFLKNPHQELRVRFDYLERVREALREADIEIPFPHLQLFIDEAKAFEQSYLMRKNGGSESKG